MPQRVFDPCLGIFNDCTFCQMFAVECRVRAVYISWARVGGDPIAVEFFLYLVVGHFRLTTSDDNDDYGSRQKQEARGKKNKFFVYGHK